MKYIKISNTKEIDLKAFTLMGASTKDDDDSKIGFFGSGLKYAMAVLLRHEIGFKIYSGIKEITIKTKREKFRDKFFDIIIINNQKTSLTIQMGKTWKPWFCLREIYCNALDEGCASIEYADEINSEKGITNFYIEYSAKLEELMKNWDNYFSQKRPAIVSGAFGKILTGSDNLIIYRRGVQAYTNDKKSVFHYDLIDLEINESRVLNSTWDLKYLISKLLAKHSDKSMIKEFLNTVVDSWEETLMWSNCEFNGNWLDILSEYSLVPKSTAGYFASYMETHKCLVLPGELIRALKKAFGDKVNTLGQTHDYEDFCTVTPTEKQSLMISKALDFLSAAELNIKYTIKPCIFNENHILGSVHRKEILLSVDLFKRGLRETIATILEETFHIESGYKDETRGFQNYLINQVIVLIEDKSGTTL